MGQQIQGGAALGDGVWEDYGLRTTDYRLQGTGK